MTMRTITALALVVLALAGVVALDRPQRHADPSGRDRILDGFSAQAVTRLTILAPGRQAVELERRAGGQLVLSGGRATDDGAVADLLGTLEYLAFRRRLPAGDEAARGLDEPRLTIRIESGGAPAIELRVGRHEATLERVWMSRSDRREVYLVDEYHARALDRTELELRRRDPLPVSPDRPGPITLELGRRRLVLRESAPGAPSCVELDGGGCALADGARVMALAERLAALRVTRFTGDVRIPDAQLSGRIVAGGVELRLGGACGGAPGERAVESILGGACVREDVLAALTPDPPLDWIERAVLPIPGRDVRRVRISDGADAIDLERSGGSWAILGPGAKRGTPVDDETMRTWLDELAAFRAADIVVIAAGSEEATGTGPVLEITADDGARRFRVALGTAPAGAGPDRVLVRREGEPVGLLVHRDVVRHFAPDSAQFRDRTVLQFEPSALAAVEFASRGLIEKAARGDSMDDWRMSSPVVLPVDLAVLTGLRETASALRARSVAASRAAPEHELDPPRRTVTFVVDPPPTAAAAAPLRLALELGVSYPDGACAVRRTGGDGVVFILERDACEALDVHLAPREVFRADNVTAVTIGKSRYERHGPSWHAVGGTRLPEGQGDALDRLIEALHAADVSGYGPLSARTTIVIERADGSVATVHVASPELTAAGSGVRHRLPPGACQDFPLICR